MCHENLFYDNKTLFCHQKKKKKKKNVWTWLC